MMKKQDENYRFAADHTLLKLRAAGIEAESPKCNGMWVDGLAANSPAAAQKELITIGE